MIYCKKAGIVLSTFLVWSSLLWGQQISGTNTNYEEGDWISYTKCRNIHSLQISPDIVYAATEGGILRYDLMARKWIFPFTVSNGLPENMVLAVAFNVATNLLWCSTPSAVAVYDRSSRIWQNSYLGELGLAPNDPILSIGFSDRNVWLESQSGRVYSSPLQMMFFMETRSNNDESIVWYGRRGFVPSELQHYYLSGSLMFIADGSNYFVQDRDLRSFRFNYYASDPWQKLWLGSSGLGMFRADRRTGDMVHLPYGLLSSDVRAIFKKGPEIWLGGIQQGDELDGITLWQRNRDRWTHFEPRLISRFRGSNVFAITSTGQSIWFGTDDGLVRYRRQNDRWRSYTTFDNLLDNRVYSLAAGKSALWVGSHDGLDRISEIRERADSVVVTHVTDWRDQVAVYDIFLDGPITWAATNYGLFSYDLRNADSGYHRGVDGPGSREVTAVARLGDSLWVSSTSTVYVYDLEDNIWRGPPGNKSFGGSYVNDIAATHNAVWVGTDDGLYKYDLLDGDWRSFTVQDGLPDPIVQKIVPDGDYLLIGSTQGLTRFYWNSPYRID